MRREQKEVDMIGRVRNGVISAALAASMIATGVPATALAAESTASLQARIADARAHFDELALASAEVGESLNDTRFALDQTRENIGVVNGQVEATQAELDEARDILAERVAANYRAGTRSLLDMVMGSSTIEEFVGAIYYADKVAESDAKAIETVKTAEAQLQEQKASLEQLEQSQIDLVAQQEQQVAALEEAEAEQAAYIKGLDSQLRQQIEEQRAAEIAAQQAAAARALAAQQTQATLPAPLDWQSEAAKKQEAAPKADDAKADDAKASEDGAKAAAPEAEKAPESAQEQEENAAPAPEAQPAEQPAPAEEPAPAEQPVPAEQPAPVEEPAPAEQPAPAEEPAPTEQPAEVVEEPAPVVEEAAPAEDQSGGDASATDDARSAILAAAYSQLGVPYVYGAESPGVALDCSGFTQYCYSEAGIDIPHSSVAQASMADKTSIDDLQAGDLVFWEGTAGGSASGSHVAIYLGDGQIIHANGTEVAVGTLSNSWTSCGSIS